VLDLCTGTADLLLEALSPEPTRRGTGVDLSPGMLRLGASKLSARGMAARAALAAGDACTLPLADASFDAALAAFGIRNVDDLPRALRELSRVLRPGAPLRILEFTEPRGALGWASRWYLRHVLPRVGGLVSGDRGAYAYLPASVARFPRPPAFAALLVEAGFRGVRWRTLTLGVACLYEGERAA
jgi:demethylmenaquinone methyltransferase/2-methoxy-6-polyprenyl-1,4-benzoquinol methylase